MNSENEDVPRTSAQARHNQVVATAINILAVAAALWTFLYPKPYLIALATSIIFPMIAVVVTNHSAGHFRFAAGWRSRRAGLLPAVLLPGVALCLRALNEMRPLNWYAAFEVTAVGGLLLFALCLAADASLRRRPRGASLVLLASLIWGFGAGLSLNALLDRSSARGYLAVIMALHARAAHFSLQYSAQLAPIGKTPWRMGQEIDIPRDLYKTVTVGDGMILLTRPGALRVAWYTFGPILHRRPAPAITLRPGGPATPH